MIKLAIMVVLLGTAGCAALRRTPPVPGDTREAVLAKFGKPTALYPAPSGEVIEFAFGPMGQQTWMARMGPDGRLVLFEQVLTADKFGTLKIDAATKADVLRTVGRPAEESYLDLPDLEVWSYRYREGDVWNSMMHLHFNRSGILTKMLNAPDPMYEYKDSGPD
jgi:hypothetical protein